MKRIALFLMTNLAIIVVLSITLRLLGVERILDEQGAGLDLNSLLIFSAVFGFGGAFGSRVVHLAHAVGAVKKFGMVRLAQQGL